MQKNHVDLILDSGAYSAWKKQEDLDVYKYIEFIAKYQDVLFAYVNLDVIPGAWGMTPSIAQVEDSARKGWENANTIREAGFEAMPVYHMGERRYWLEKMVNEGFEYIGISPANDRTTEQKRVWLDEVFGFLCGKKGYPEVKTHAFGVTAIPLVYRYPWYSIDSTRWLLVGAYGQILVPPPNKAGKFDFTVSPDAMFISDQELGVNAQALGHGRHYQALGKEMRDYVDGYLTWLADPLENKYLEKFTVDELKGDYDARQRVNVRYFIEAMNAFPPQQFLGKKIGLFQESCVSTTKFGRESAINQRIMMAFTINNSKKHSDILEDAGAQERLVSYYFLKDTPSFDLREYVATGRMKETTTRRKKLKV